jgi:hypothetical protein
LPSEILKEDADLLFRITRVLGMASPDQPTEEIEEEEKPDQVYDGVNFSQFDRGRSRVEIG